VAFTVPIPRFDYSDQRRRISGRLRRYDDRPLQAACRHGNESMIQMRRSLTEEEHRQRLMGESGRDGKR
jgi:hypothetical protein